MDRPNLFHTDGSYDPQKAHEYYERTKKLKGRATGIKETTSGSGQPPPRATTPPKKPGVATTAQIQAKAQVLQNKLDALKKQLASLVAQAKAESGVKDTTPAAKKAASSKKESDKTAAEKKADAKRSKEYRDKHPQASKTDSTESLQAQIKAVEAKIAKAKEDLRAAVAKARSSLAKQPKPTNGQSPLKQTERSGQNGR